MDGCQLKDDPQACFARNQQSHLQKRNRHSWESIGPCQGCRYAYSNAVKAFVPEPDMEPQQTKVRIDPDDFLESPPAIKPVKPGRKPTTHCRQGHPYAKHGRKRNDGGYRCRICDAAKRLQRYHAKKNK